MLMMKTGKQVDVFTIVVLSFDWLWNSYLSWLALDKLAAAVAYLQLVGCICRSYIAYYRFSSLIVIFIIASDGSVPANFRLSSDLLHQFNSFMIASRCCQC